MSDSKITGYRTLPPETVALVNAIKQQGNELGAMFDRLAKYPEVDQRWLAIAKTDLQKGFMFLVRAVTKPSGF